MKQRVESMQESIDLERLNKGSFIQRLAIYYSDFLSTDFKKGSLPKRRYQARDKKGRRSGIPLEKFPSFLPNLNKKLSAGFDNKLSISIKLGSHKSKLSPYVESAIKSSIEGLDFSGLDERNANALDEFKKLTQKPSCDLEALSADLVNQVRRNIGLEIGVKIIRLLEPTFERSASNLIDSLVSVDDDIAELLVGSFEEALPSAVSSFIGAGDSSQLLDLVSEMFSEGNVKAHLVEFFDGFSASDLFTELRELSSVQQLEDNLEHYLYLGEIKHQNHQFPLFYIPFKIEMDGTKFNLTFEPRLLVNKKGIDYVARLIQQETGTPGASVVDERIVYVDAGEVILEIVDGLVQKVLRALQFDGKIIFGKDKATLKNSSVSLNNSLSFALFDKSDESMLTDYEELLDKLGQGEMLGFLNDLIDGFLDKNPTNIIEEIYDDWDEMSTSDRLVFDSPIPLVEEQRKIIKALESNNCRFITVEGPPGTGKSHTISAIAFGAILNKQSILILSDKKEALDVVENKLNETLAKVRPSGDFINPILRLGRAGANFNKLTSLKSIDKLRTQYREIRKDRGKLDAEYKKTAKVLKDGIRNKVDQLSKIDTKAIFEMEKEVYEFKKDYSKFTNFIEIFEDYDGEFEVALSAIASLVSLRNKCKKLPPDFVSLCEKFGDNGEALARGIMFSQHVSNGCETEDIFILAPKITHESLQFIEKKIIEARNTKGLFGYLFAGNKLNAIKQDVSSVTGCSFQSRGLGPVEDLFVSLDNLLREGKDFFRPLVEEFPNELGLIDSFIG